MAILDICMSWSCGFPPGGGGNQDTRERNDKMLEEVVRSRGDTHFLLVCVGPV